MNEITTQKTQRKENKHDWRDVGNAPSKKDHGDAINGEFLEISHDLVIGTSLKTGSK
jgi:hypothetical protein